jgi:hypothetical protein
MGRINNSYVTTVDSYTRKFSINFPLKCSLPQMPLLLPPEPEILNAARQFYYPDISINFVEMEIWFNSYWQDIQREYM